MKKIIFLSFLSIQFFSYCQIESKGYIKSEITSKFELNYILVSPENKNEQKPLIVFLHGSGEKGNDLEKVKSVGPLKYLKTNSIDAYVLAPQCQQDKYWESEELYQLIQKIVSENKIDKSRIYLTGLSMGAWASWNLVYKHPDLFAALVPIAGFVDRIPIKENCKIKEIPIRMFHGLQDKVVDIYYSITMYNLLKDCHKDIKFEIFNDAEHDSWSRVYDNKGIYDWMLLQKKSY